MITVIPGWAGKMEFFKHLIIICPLVFLAGFVDSVAGGGGLISLPAYLFVGFPAHLASGTNKVVNATGTCVAAGKYIKNGNVRPKAALLAAAGSLIGSAIGTNIAVLLDENVLKAVILLALPAVAVTLAVKKDFVRDDRLPQRTFTKRGEAAACFTIGLVAGCYDGVIGPGTGTLLIMAFSLVLRMDLLNASGCAKVGNLASNLAACVIWIMNGQVYFKIVIPAAACSILGNWLGARYAIRGGGKKIRRMIFLVLALMCVKLIYDLTAG